MVEIIFTDVCFIGDKIVQRSVVVVVLLLINSNTINCRNNKCVFMTSFVNFISSKSKFNLPYYYH